MTLFLQLAFLLSVILLSAKMAGYLSIRMGQPSVLGELLAGRTPDEDEDWAKWAAVKTAAYPFTFHSSNMN